MSRARDSRDHVAAPAAARFVAQPDVLPTELSDGTGVLLDLRSKFYFTVNATALWLWTELERAGEAGRELETLLRALTETFAVAPEEARADIEQLLEQLLQHGLIRRETS